MGTEVSLVVIAKEQIDRGNLFWHLLPSQREIVSPMARNDNEVQYLQE